MIVKRHKNEDIFSPLELTWFQEQSVSLQFGFYLSLRVLRMPAGNASQKLWSCTVAIPGMHRKIRHLKYEGCWPKHQLMKTREKIQICAGILCWTSWSVSFSSCYIAEVTPMRKAMGQGQVLKAPLCGQRSVVEFEGSWATAWSWDKLGQAGTRCSAWARTGDTPGAAGWGSDPSAWRRGGCWTAIAQE